MMDKYQKALIAHLEESSHALRNYEVDSVYFGGGTPSYYGAERLMELFNVLKLNGNVRLDAEVTVECNPDSVSRDELKFLRQEGVNRLSIGVQASNNDLLKIHFYNSALKISTENGRKQLIKVDQRSHIDGMAAFLCAMTVRQKYWNEIGRQLVNERR